LIKASNKLDTRLDHLEINQIAIFKAIRLVQFKHLNFNGLEQNTLIRFSYMNKDLILTVFVTFFCLISFTNNSNAATPFTYLSCKAIILKNDSEEAAFSSKKDYLQIGSNNGYYFYKFKDLQKKTKVTIYEQGMFLNEDWRTNKPKKFASDKWEFSKEDNIYSYKDTLDLSSEVMTYGFAIQKGNNGKYFNTTTFLWKKNDEKTADLVMDQECDEVKKDIFKSLIKNGVN